MSTVEIEAGDVVRLILQFLKENGLQRTFQTLQEESQISLNMTDDLEQLKNDIQRGNWDAVLHTVRTLRLPQSKLIDLYEQIVVELIELREIDTARALLRQSEPMDALKQDQPDRYLRMEHLLQRSYFDPLEAYAPGMNKEKRRAYLMEEIGTQVVQAPTSRLMALISQALRWQRYIGVVPDDGRMDLFTGQAAKPINEAEVVPQRSGRIIKFPKKTDPTAAAFSPDGLYLVSGSSDGFIEIWDPTTGKLKKDLEFQAKEEFMMHDTAILSLAFSRDSDLLASGSHDGKIKVWRVGRGQLLRRLEAAHGSGVTCLAFARDGTQILSSSMDGTARIHGLKSGKCLREMRGHTSYVLSCAYADDNVITGSSDGTVKVWDLRTAHCLRTFRPPTAHSTQDIAISSVIPLTSDPTQMVVCTKSSQAFIMTLEGQIVRGYEYNPTVRRSAVSEPAKKGVEDESEMDGSKKVSFMSCTLSSRAEHLYCCTDDGHIVAFDVKTGEQEALIEAHERAILFLAHHPHRNIIASLSEDGMIKTWTS